MIKQYFKSTHLFWSVSHHWYVVFDDVQRLTHNIINSVDRVFEFDDQRHRHVHDAQYGLFCAFQAISDHSVRHL